MHTATISILVRNHFGVLNKVTGLFSRRGYNIKSLSVGETHQPHISRITVQAEGDAQQLRQIVCQVRKLEEVYRAELLPDSFVSRELMLVKLRPQRAVYSQLMQIATDYALKSAAAGDCVILETTGETSRLDALIELVRPFHIVELSRTGATALTADAEPLFTESQPSLAI